MTASQRVLLWQQLKKIFLDNGIDPLNLRLVRCTADFIKILGVSEFPIGLCWWLVESANRQYKSMGNLLCSRIFIKSAVDPINLKFGVMITWVNTNSKKKFFFVAIATSVN